MKVFLEADFAKGSGALRWEGVTARRIRSFLVSTLTIVSAAALLLMHRG